MATFARNNALVIKIARGCDWIKTGWQQVKDSKEGQIIIRVLPL